MASKLGTLTLDLICRTGNFTQGMRDASNSANRELGRIEQSTNGATKAIKGLAVAALGSFSIHQVIAYTDSYTNLQNRLKLVTNSQQELSTATQDTFNIAQATAQSWGSVVQVYQRFAENSSRLGITMQQTASLTDTVSKAISISGASAASAEAALMQFGQALASGVLRGEEFNSIVEQAPALLKAIATGLGVNIGELRKMAGEGQLTGDVVIKALNNAKTSVDNLFSKTDFTIAQSFTQLNDSVAKFVGEAGSGSGAAKTLASSIKMVADNIEPIANTGAAIAVGVLAKAMVGATVSATNATYSLFAKIDATLSERQANIAATQAEVASATAEARSTEITLINAKATHTQIMAEIELEKVRLSQQITNQGRMATMTRMAQLGQLQAQVALEIAAAETAQSASSARLSAALTAQAAVTSRLALGKAALMTLFSPMGIAIAATAAAFYYLSSSAEEVKESLATQSDSVENLTKKYLELNSVQAQVESVRLRKEIDSQNDSIDDAASSMTRFAYLQKELFKISGNDYVQYKQAIESIKTGAGDASAILQKMVISGRFSQDQIDKLVEYSGAVADARKNINQNKTALDLLSQTSGAHTVVNEKLNQQIATQSELTKIATKDFLDLKNGLVDSLEAQVEYVRLNGGSEQQITNLNKVIKDYSLNQISATNAVKRFNGIAELPNSILSSLQNYATKTDKSKVEVNLLAGKVKELNGLTGNSVKSTDERTAAHEREKSAIEGTKKAYAEYSKTALSNIKEMAARAQMQKMGFSENQIAERMAVLKALNFDPTLAHSKTGIEMKNLADISAKMKDTEDAKADAIKAQNKELEKQQNVLRLSSQIISNASKYNFGAIETKNGLPAGTLSAIHAIETGNTGLTNQVNKETGATGGFQFLAGTAKQYGVNDRKDLAQSAEGAGKYMGYLLKLFKGDLEKAVRAYHAGEGNVQRGTNIGKYNNDYWAKFQGFVAGKSGFTGSSKDFTDSLKTQTEYLQKTIQEIDQLRAQYSDADLVRNQKRITEISEAERLGQTQLVSKINERYSNEARLAELQFEEQIKGFSWAEDEKLKHQAEINKTQIALSNELNDIQKQLAKESIDDQLAYELQQYRKTQLQKQFDQINSYKSIQSQIKGLSVGVDDIFAKATMSPREYASWALKNNRDNAQLDLKNQLVSTEQNIATSDSFSSEDDRYQALLDAHQEYLYAKSALDVQYSQQHRDLEDQTHAASLAGYGAMFGMMGSMFDAYGDKESTGYKVAFAMQKAFVLSSAILNAKGAVMAAWNDPTNTTIWQKMAAAAATVVQTNDLMSAIQGVALTGMAHDGIANVPEEGTWLLSKGERVLNPQDNKALTNMINNGGGGGDVSIQVNITDSGVNTSGGNTQNQKQLGDAIGNAVRAVIIREKRQGGLLSK